MLAANIANIQHFNVHDGTGLRTTIFFQGCGLRCAWCQNPELLEKEPVMMFRESLCTHCMACVKACPAGALTWNGEAFAYDDSRCTRCGRCEEECYFLARTLSSHPMTVEQVFHESIGDEQFYRGGGGITLSGGEPLLARDFVLALLRRYKERNIGVTVETAGFVPWETFAAVRPLVDTFFYDLKLVSQSLRERYLGTRSDQMLTNLRRLAAARAHIVLRVPLIPGVNDTTEEFGTMLDFVDTLAGIRDIHILPFHQLGASKYEMIGASYRLAGLDTENEEHIRCCIRRAEARGYRVSRGGAGFRTEEMTG